ncbi:hypothetical protein JCM17136A_11150 [Phocaeicola sartorii JCM 17136 = DSM 21941]
MVCIERKPATVCAGLQWQQTGEHKQLGINGTPSVDLCKHMGGIQRGPFFEKFIEIGCDFLILNGEIQYPALQ